MESVDHDPGLVALELLLRTGIVLMSPGLRPTVTPPPIIALLGADE
jgi:hypothetical protein